MDKEYIDEALNRIFKDFDTSKLVTEDEKKRLLEAENEKERLRIAEERIEALDIPKRLMVGRSRIQTDNQWGQMFEKLKPHIGKGSIFVFRGKPGTGKSQLAVELMIYAAETKNLTGRFITFSDLQLDVKGSFGQGQNGGEKETIAALTRPGVLVIDEFDWVPNKAEKVTDNYWQGVIYHILNKRYYAMKDTLLTSNKTEDEFRQTTIASIKSRISETGGVISTDDWTDWRAERRF